MKQRAASGFTLIELMIAVVLIAILARIALPAYSEYVKKAARAEARAILMENALGMEQIFTLNNNYNNPVPTLKYPVSPKTGTTKYNISIDTTMFSATQYRLKAVPVKADKCGTFLIDNTGLRSLGTDASGGTVADCWGNG